MALATLASPEGVRPFVDRNYRTIATGDSRAIAGLSVGGGGTTDFALESSCRLYQLAERAALEASWHETPGAHFCTIWRVFPADFGAMLFR